MGARRPGVEPDYQSAALSAAADDDIKVAITVEVSGDNVPGTVRRRGSLDFG